MMETIQIKCPVCGCDHDVRELCPQCGFEYHLMVSPPKGWLQEAEKKRLADACARWQALQESRQKAEEGKTPLGFLITQRLVVYSLYEGRNVFGAPGGQAAEGEHFQQLMFPGVILQQRHFAIDAARGEDGRKVNFSACMLANGSTAICVNSQTKQLSADSLPIGDNDNILICPEGGTTCIELKLRKNLNR